MSLLQTKINEGSCILHADYRSGSVIDSKGRVIGTQSNTQLISHGLNVPNNGLVSYPHAGDIAALTNISAIIIGEFKDVESGQFLRPISKRVGAGVHFDVSIDANNIVFNNGASYSRAIDLTDAKSIGFVYTDNDSFLTYKNGVVNGAAITVTNSISAYDTPLTIGGGGIANNNYGNYIIKAVAVFNTILTATEIAQLTNELCESEPDQRPWDHYEAFYPSLANNVLADGDMELSGVASWITGAGAVLTKQPSNLYGGARCLRVADPNFGTAYQNVLTIGKKYRVRGWARGDGINIAGVLVGTTLGFTSTASTEWQWFDFILEANAVFFQLRIDSTTADGYVEFDHILVEECGTTAFQIPFKGEMGAIANETNFTSGQLENTLLTVDNGSFKMITEKNNGKLEKVVECVIDGDLVLEFAPPGTGYGYRNIGSGYTAFTPTQTITLSARDKLIYASENPARSLYWKVD